MVSANDLLAMFIGLELQSLSLYVLAALNRNSLLSSEAGIKYFILGNVAIYGMWSQCPIPRHVHVERGPL